jgi:hypothetical protein
LPPVLLLPVPPMRPVLVLPFPALPLSPPLLVSTALPKSLVRSTLPVPSVWPVR